MRIKLNKSIKEIDIETNIKMAAIASGRLSKNDLKVLANDDCPVVANEAKYWLKSKRELFLDATGCHIGRIKSSMIINQYLSMYTIDEQKKMTRAKDCKDMMYCFALSTSSKVQLATASAKDCPSEILNYLSNSIFASVRQTVARNANTQVATLIKMCHDGGVIQIDLIGNQKLPKIELIKFCFSENREVSWLARYVVMHSKNRLSQEEINCAKSLYEETNKSEPQDPHSPSHLISLDEFMYFIDIASRQG